MIFLNPLLYLIYVKMSNNLSVKFYQQNKDIRQKQAFKKYQNLSKQEKNKQQYGRERYKILSEDEEQNLLSMEKNNTE